MLYYTGCQLPLFLSHCKLFPQRLVGFLSLPPPPFVILQSDATIKNKVHPANSSKKKFLKSTTACAWIDISFLFLYGGYIYPIIGISIVAHAWVVIFQHPHPHLIGLLPLCCQLAKKKKKCPPCVCNFFLLELPPLASFQSPNSGRNFLLFHQRRRWFKKNKKSNPKKKKNWIKSITCRQSQMFE